VPCGTSLQAPLTELTSDLCPLSVSKMKIIDLIIAIIFTVVAVLEAFGAFACWKVRTAALGVMRCP
jgi:hypothetical protein